jgi:hypothetical protein
MTAKVLDSWAMLAFFEDEPSADAVEELLHRAVLEKHKPYLSVINWGEIYYSTLRKASQAEAEARSKRLPPCRSKLSASAMISSCLAGRLVQSWRLFSGRSVAGNS